MLSILIPTYHYNAYPLALEIEQQALATGIKFELICIDDGSFSHLNVENQKINTLTNCKFIEAKQNAGRTKTRQLLAESAQYSCLLFLDADVMPTTGTFIKKLLNEYNKSYDVIFGGIAYEENKPVANKLLRWNYGKKRETKTVSTREKIPYLSILSGGFCIKKALFVMINSKFLQNAYGLDILFTRELRKAKTRVKHIDNPLYHLGIENNEVFLEKTKKALDTLYLLKKQNTISDANKLLKSFKLLKTIGLSSTFGKIIKTNEAKIERNLMSETPNLFLFDLYRLGYFCRIRS